MHNAAEEIRQELLDSIRVKSALDQAFCAQVAELAHRTVSSLRAGGKLVVFGNGGSAADAQHLAAELIGRFERERQPIRALALTTNTSTLTALGNDYSYDLVFARQVEAWAEQRDVVLGISTSGNSKNVLAAFESARKKGAYVAAFTGEGGGKAAAMCDLLLAVPSKNTARIQECHITIGHILCGLIERAMCEKAP